MKSVFIPWLSILALACALVGCEKAPLPPDDKVLFQAVEDNANAINKRDVEAAMATFHPKMADFAGLREFLTQTFSNVELKVTLSDLKVVTASPEEARVSFKLKTDQVTKEGIVPLNIVEGVDTLRPENGTWKIYSTVKTKVTPLNQAAPEAAEQKPASPEPVPATATPNSNPSPSSPAPAEKPPQ